MKQTNGPIWHPPVSELCAAVLIIFAAIFLGACT